MSLFAKYIDGSLLLLFLKKIPCWCIFTIGFQLGFALCLSAQDLTISPKKEKTTHTSALDLTDFQNLSNLNTNAKEKGQWAVSAGLKYGKIVQHTPNFTPAITEMSSIYELNVMQNTNGSKYWHQLHGFPIVGVSFLYGRYGDADVFGQSYSVVPSMSFLSRMRRFNLHYRVGVGVNYISKHFDPVTNPVNNVIGSPINSTIMFMGALEWKAHPQWRLLATFDFIHYSNAKVQHPNLGINVPTWGLTVKHYPHRQTFSYRIHDLPPLDKGVRAAMRLSVGFQETEQSGGPRYNTYIGSLFLTKRMGYKGQLLTGMEFNYYMEILHYVRSQTMFEGEEAIQALKVSPYIGYEFLFGRVSAVAHLGTYVFDPFKSRAPIYTKLGVQYYAWDTALRNGKNLFLGVYMKSHYAKADYLELAVGCVF